MNENANSNRSCFLNAQFEAAPLRSQHGNRDSHASKICLPQTLTKMKRSLKAGLKLSPIPVLGLYYGLEWALLYIFVYSLFALSKVLYYCLTFNDCQLAADSLKREILEARTDLARKGFNFATQ